MMLKAFLPKIEQRYVFVGSAVGAVLPLLFFAISRMSGFPGGFFAWALDNPSQFTLAAMPVWMGLVSLQFARSKRRRLKVEAARRLQERRLLHAALHDELTGIANRAAFQAAAREATASGLHFALLLLDLDRFKLVNDTKGHHAGDLLLKEFAKRLSACEHSRAGIGVFRLGGDEFAVLVEEDVAEAELERLAETIKLAVALPFDLGDSRASVGVSVGIAVSAHPGEPVEAILQRADLALYSAKDISGPAHAFYNEALAAASLARLDIDRDLVRAIAVGEFCLEFQPIISAETRDVTAMEAMVRWLHPQKGLLASERFMPAAERSGHISQLERWVLRSACVEAVRWPSEVGVTVNISRALFEDDGFPASIVGCLDYSGLMPSRLTIEISESVLTLDETLVRGRLAQLRALGVKVGVQDFGLGLTSLNRLVGVELDRLKLERSFTESLLRDVRGEGLMDALMKLGAAMRIATSVEGIEDERQIEFVRHRGASEVQGHYLSGPLAADDVVDFLSARKEFLSSGAA